MTVKLQNGGCQTFSSSNMISKVSTLLTKLSLCYRLYSQSVPLCRHEVCFLSVRCATFGCWFPVTFPSSSLLRKFHVLTYHVPEKAVKKGTVGMEAEYCYESIQPAVNKLDSTPQPRMHVIVWPWWPRVSGYKVIPP